MRMKISHLEDFWAGVLFLTIALVFLWAGWDLQAGGASRMGPGYFPRIVCGALGIIGVLLLSRGLALKGTPLGRWNVRGVTTLLGSVVIFGLTLRSGGLLAAGLLTMALSSAAVPGARWGEALLVSVIMVAVCCLLFVYVIGLPFPLLPKSFG